MQVDRPNTSDIKPAPATTAAASSTTSMDVDTPVAAAASSGGSLQSFLHSIDVDHKKQADAILKNLLKTLSSLKKNPNLLANRKFRCDNIAVKKFIMDVEGALNICKFVGYQVVELTDKKTPYLVIDEPTLASEHAKEKLDAAIDAVAAQLNEYERQAAGGAAAAAAKPAAPSEPKMCIGGCGFCGSAETEGYCSVCFKKKFLSGGLATPAKPPAAAAATSSSSSRHTDPFTTPPKAASAAQRPLVAGDSAVLSLGGGSSNNEQKCLKHCGRIGSPKFNGFCEPCFQRITAAGAKAPPKRWRCLFDGAMVKLRAVHRFNLGKRPVQTNKNRCWICSKKLGITGFECRCMYVFCSQHRLPSAHECKYDVKGLHRQKLKKENELIMHAKLLDKI